MSAFTRTELGRRSDKQIAGISSRVLNRLCKWRTVYAGWQLGTRPATDPEAQAVRDHRDATMLLRAEVNALTACLIDGGFFTAREFTEQLIVEAQALDAKLEKTFPGFKSADHGMDIDVQVAAQTMKGWRP